MADRTPDDPIRLGVIGVGPMGRFVYMPALRNCRDAVLTAICTRDADRVRAVAEEFGVKSSWTDYRDMLCDAGLGAVVVCTPDDTHHEMTMAAIAGVCMSCVRGRWPPMSHMHGI